MITTKKTTYGFLVMIGLLALLLVNTPICQAQNWAPMPPYNTLWPLWSPALSPIDAVTGLPVPLVSALTPLTVLPVQPGLTWDPSVSYPWLLYNTPLGMAYYDPYDGVNFWPPSYLLKPNGNPLPLFLPAGYASLPATDASWLSETVPIGNSAIIPFLAAIPGALMGGILPTFLSASALLPPIILPPPIPTAFLPPLVPTVFLPPPIPTAVALPPLVPTIALPALTAPLPLIPTITTPTFIAPTVFAPTAFAPTTIIPTIVPPAPVIPTAVLSGIYAYPFI